MKKTSASTLLKFAVSSALLLGISAANAQNVSTQALAEQPPDQPPDQPTQSVKDGVKLPANRNIYALTSDNAIYVLRTNASQYVRLGRVSLSDGGNLVGIDFRPADRSLTKFYALTDSGNLFSVDTAAVSNGIISSTLIAPMNPRFTGGLGNVMDFNPAVNALRVIGSNDQNLAVVNGANGENLNTVAVQTKFAYVTGDVNAGQDPEITGGAYTNNFVGATTTLFYMIDSDKDTLVTIADKTATGSSNTGGGKLQTLGKLVNTNGQPINMSPSTDFDIYTDNNGVNFLVGQTSRWLFSIDLTQINPTLQVGKTQNIIVRTGPAAPLPGANAPLTGGAFDIAIPPRQQ